MPWVKRNLTLVFGGGVALALLGLAGWYLYSGIAKNKTLAGDLELRKGTYDSLWGSSVFPGPENVKAAEAEKARLEGLIKEFKKSFKPIEYSKGLNPLGLSTLVLDAVNSLQDGADAAGVDFVEDFKYSFTGPASETLKDPHAIDLVSWQVADIKAVVGILYKSRIHNLKSIQRIKVESLASAGANDYLSTPNHPITNNLAVIMPYQITFTCFSEGLAEVLNGISTSPHGLVVKYLGLTNHFTGASSSASIPYGEMDRLAGLIESYDDQSSFAAQRFPRELLQLQGGRNLNRPQPGQPNTQRRGPRPQPTPFFNSAQPPTKAPAANLPQNYLREKEVEVTLKLQTIRLN